MREAGRRGQLFTHCLSRSWAYCVGHYLGGDTYPRPSVQRNSKKCYTIKKKTPTQLGSTTGRDRPDATRYALSTRHKQGLKSWPLVAKKKKDTESCFNVRYNYSSLQSEFSPSTLLFSFFQFFPRFPIFSGPSAVTRKKFPPPIQLCICLGFLSRMGCCIAQQRRRRCQKDTARELTLRLALSIRLYRA